MKEHKQTKKKRAVINVAEIKKRVSGWIVFLERDLWRLSSKELTPGKSFLIKHLRVIVLALKGFNEDKVSMRASALTYYTLFALVPVVALAFGIAKGFGLESYLESELQNALSNREEVFTWIMSFSKSMLETARGGMVAGVGFVVLVYAVMNVLSNIEASFNAIWKIHKGRTLSRKFSDYFSMMFIAPFFLILSSGATVFLGTQITRISEDIQLIGFFSPVLMFLVQLVPYVLVWILFTLIYVVMPNTNVRFGGALLAGIVAGTMFQLAQWGYIYFQVGVSRYNAIYGSFAAVPLLLLWLQTSWLIVLFGSEVSFAYQNVEKYIYDKEAKTMSFFNRKLISLYICHLVIKRFKQGETPLTASQIAHELEIPIRLLREVLYDLIELHILSETITDHPKESGYQPGQDINRLSIKVITEMLENKGGGELIANDAHALIEIRKVLEDFQQTINTSNKDKLLKDI